MRVWLILGFVLLLRLPFLNQPIQGDDVYYLEGAQYAQTDPAHPHHARYVYEGDVVDMRGHPHPPLNAWILAGLLALIGDIREVPFHAAYIVFSLIAALSVYALSRRFSPQPVLATLLFLVTPVLVVNGTSLESDVPFAAFWLASIALFVSGRVVAAVLAMSLAAMMSYQAVVLTPILCAYVWLHRRDWRAGYLLALTPVVVVGGWQLLERVTGGTLPAQVLAGYFSTYGLQQASNKLLNAGALTAHAGWIVFPGLAIMVFRRRWIWGLGAALAGIAIDPHPLFWVSFGTGVLILASCVRKPDFLTAWILLFFSAALILFFAGSARYLLPMAAPVAILASHAPRKWVAGAVACQGVISLLLAVSNYEHWNAYREFAARLRKDLESHRTWANTEWGLRFYLQSEGALAPLKTQPYRPGDLIVRSELSFPIPVTTGGGQLLPIASTQVKPLVPLRLNGLHARSGYSTATKGLRPFDITLTPVDEIRASVIVEREPTLSYIRMNDAKAAEHIISGVYELENTWRWTSGEAIFALKPPSQPAPVKVAFYVPKSSPVRKVTVVANGQTIGEQAVGGPGQHTLGTSPVTARTVTLKVDQTFSPPGDRRQLGVILSGIGYE